MERRVLSELAQLGPRDAHRLIARTMLAVEAELDAALPVLRRAGAASAEVVEVGSVELSTDARVIVATRSAATGARVRAAGRPSSSRPGGISATSKRRDHR